MSSEGEDVEGRIGEKSRKKRRVGRACDMCRQKKVRCDGEQRPGLRCSNCISTDDKCTFKYDAPKRRSRPKGYAERLEQRVAQLEKLLNEMFPGTDLSRGFDAALQESARLSDDQYDIEDDDDNINLDTRRQTDKDFAYAIPPSLGSPPFSYPKLQSGISAAVFGPTPDAALEADLNSSEDELTVRQVLHGTVKIGSGIDPVPSSSGSPSQSPALHTRAQSLDRRFIGKSSGLKMIQTAVDLRKDFWQSEGVARESVSRAATEPRSPNPNTGQQPRESLGDRESENMLPCGCPDYGIPHPWIDPPPRPALVFPHASLMRELISLYFDVHNNYYPLLHRPSFERAIEAGKHIENTEFGEVVLLVCALGSRWSGDPGVLVGVGDEDGTIADGNTRDVPTAGMPSGDGYDGQDEEDWHSAGWKWFRQVRIGRKMLLHAKPTVHDLQTAALCAMYMRGSSVPEAARWVMGVGIRLAQDMGAHRKRTYSATPTVEEEQLKRAFWVLLSIDGSLSPSLGRACGIQHEDFDLDLPIDCDDEYWEADPSFVQPAGKPSKISFFNCCLKLLQIHAFAIRTLYSTTKSKTILGFVGPQWEERTLAELDGALAQWLSSIPSHLRWDARNPNPTFLLQSGLLHISHSAMKITFHRPFIGIGYKFGNTLPARVPSMETCVNAARSCVHITEVLGKRSGHGSHTALGVMSHYVFTMLTAGIVLMLNQSIMIDGQDAGQRDMVKEMKEMADVHKIMEVLKNIEGRWHTAGRIWDMLYGLAMARDLPLPSSCHASVTRSSNRTRRVAKNARSGPAQIQRSASTPTTLSTDRRIHDFVHSDPRHSDPRHAVQRSLSQVIPGPTSIPEANPISSTSRVQSPMDFDLTPSVFAMPRQPSVPVHTEPLEPSFDSVFAPPSAATPELHPGESLSAVSSGQWHETSLELEEYDMSWSAGPPAASTSTAPVSLPSAPSITAEIMDTIQSRQSSWLPHASAQGIANTPEWASAVEQPGLLSGMAYSPNVSTILGGPSMQNLPEMWSAVPLGYEWDEWGSYINAFGTDGQGSSMGVPPFAHAHHAGPAVSHQHPYPQQQQQRPHQPPMSTSPRTRQHSTLPFR